jgi:polyisoprenoid-binding protein YceI
MSTATLTQWKLDPTHSEIQFKVKHLVITTVTGQFNEFEASFESLKDDFSDASISFSANIASIDTNNAQRDAHLKSPDFFDADNHPTLSFAGKGLNKTGEGTYTLTGDLTIRGITKEVTLNVEFGGEMVDPYGQHKAGFEVSGKISRKEFGLLWSYTTEAGGAVVSDEVRIVASVQFVKQA